ncbi:MAG: protochlorophyllide oxidoreductase [Aulosira sp. ZfuVER01]|nr:protochlorophyllide oxidoreductase [Aulosira sp. ZfuVER01]MDZ7997637.1 protochlorophyllide oxidoreductase [Aulosira sp. DedVER01a]MDZ8055380.1 protochlorophyllide oxidoreductase [Aulosira sp. ZfuCHP01]
MNSNEIRAGSSEMMTHAQRQACLKTSPLGKLFGVAHLLPEVEETTSNHHLSSTQAKVAGRLFVSEQSFQYSDVPKHYIKGRSKPSISVFWMQLYLNIENKSSPRKKLAAI